MNLTSALAGVFYYERMKVKKGRAKVTNECLKVTNPVLKVTNGLLVPQERDLP